LATVAALGHAASGWADDPSERDAWQRPADVLDALGVGPGAAVADVGSGDGYFTFHIARRVGSTGMAIAEDIDGDDLAKVERKAEAEGLAQVRTVLGATDDPRLPEGALDAVLVVNAYHEMVEHDAMLLGMVRALKPGGRLGIIDKRDEPGESRATYRGRHSLPAAVVLEDAARSGLLFRGEEPGFRRPRRGGEDWYFLVFVKPGAPPAD
jgi:ubiquinone/menaquinone biosynthesis C-methylase UbiE